MTDAETLDVACKILVAHKKYDVMDSDWANVGPDIASLLLAHDAALTEARAENERLLAGLEKQIQECGCKQSCGCVTHDGGGICPGARECYRCQKTRDLIAEHNEANP